MPIFAPSKLVLPGTDGLVGLWDPSIQGAGGTKLVDLSGYNSHGTFGTSSDVSWETTSRGVSLYFDESTNGVNGVPKNINGYPFSVSFWTRSTATTWSTLFWMGDGTRTDKMFVVWFRDVSGHITISARNASEKYTASTNAFNDGNWHHVVAVFATATDRRLYVDGNLEASNASSVPFITSMNKWTLGLAGDSSPGAAYEGHLDSVSLYNCELSPSVIRSFYRDSRQMFRREPIEFWGALVGSGGTSQALAGVIAAQAAVTGSMSLAASLAGSTAAVSTVSAAISVGMGISGLITGTTALTGRVAVVRGISGAIAAVTTVSGGLTVARNIQGAIASQSVVSGSLSTDKKLAGLTTVQSVVSGSLSTDKKLAGLTTVQSVVSGSLSTDKKLAGLTTVQSVVSGSLSTDKKLAGLTTVQSVVSGSLSVGKKLAGAVTAQSVVSGSLSVEGAVDLQGIIAAQSVVVGALSVGKKLVGSSSVQSVVTGSLSVSKKVQGAITSQSVVVGGLAVTRNVQGVVASQSAVVGSLSVGKKLVGVVASQSVVSGALTIKGSVELQGAITSQSVVVGALSVGRKLAGSTAAQSVVTGTLTVEEILVTLQGSIAAQSAVTCSISIVREVQGTVVAQSVVTGTLSRVVSLKGSLAATSSLSANLSTLLIELVGSIAAQSTVTGALGVESAPVISAGTLPQSTILAAYLKAQDLFSDPSEDDDWPVFTRRFPEASDVANNLGCLYDTTSIVDGKGMGGTENERHGIQFRIRGVGYSTTSSKLALTLDNLKTVAGENVTVESRVFKIHNIQRTTTIHHLTRDKKRRDHFVTNLLLAYSEL